MKFTYIFLFLLLTNCTTHKDITSVNYQEKDNSNTSATLHDLTSSNNIKTQLLKNYLDDSKAQIKEIRKLAREHDSNIKRYPERLDYDEEATLKTIKNIQNQNPSMSYKTARQLHILDKAPRVKDISQLTTNFKKY